MRLSREIVTHINTKGRALFLISPIFIAIQVQSLASRLEHIIITRAEILDAEIGT